MRIISIAIIDDHTLLCESLAAALNQINSFKVVGFAVNRDQAIKLVAEKSPSVALLDINMQPVSGFRIAEEILANHPRQKILGISSTVFPSYVKKLVKIGCKGYVSKSSEASELAEGIMNVANGYTYVSSDLQKLLNEVATNANANEGDELSVREIEILREMAAGCSSREIADTFGISLRTVETHRHHIMKKTGAKNTAALLMFMVSQGLL